MRDIRKEIYETLSKDEALTALLAEGKESVYMAISEDAGTYPVVVIKEVDNTPAFADDKELMNFIRYQITIVTHDGEFLEIERIILQDMYGLGFSRSTTTEWNQGGTYYRALQFIIKTGVD